MVGFFGGKIDFIHRRNDYQLAMTSVPIITNTHLEGQLLPAVCYRNFNHPILVPSSDFRYFYFLTPLATPLFIC